MVPTSEKRQGTRRKVDALKSLKDLYREQGIFSGLPVYDLHMMLAMYIQHLAESTLPEWVEPLKAALSTGDRVTIVVVKKGQNHGSDNDQDSDFD